MKNNRKRNSKTSLFSSIAFLIIAIIYLLNGKFNFNNIFNTNTNSNISINDVNNITIDNDEFKKLIDSVEIHEAEDVDYNRDDWDLSNGYIFYDENRNEKTGLRNYVLSETTSVDIKSDEFSYTDPYSGEIGNDYSSYDYDHIIPVHYVAQHGGNSWTEEEKQEYYYNTENGVDVNSSLNRIKSDKGPSEWLPEINQKWYCYKWVEIANKYNISISQDDYNMILVVYNE